MMSTRSLSFRVSTVSLLLAALCPLAPAQLASGQARAWEHESSDIKPNARIHFGAFDNGMRYAWMANPEPKQRCYLRLHVNAGSLNESDSEQGMAHVLEHMAFNGSEHFKAGTLVEWFQKHGMAFGADTNASTGFSETVYKLDMPTSDAGTIREGLTMLADVVHGLTLDPVEVKDELGVIDGEERERDSADFRAAIADLKDQFAGSLVARRIPIGTKEIRAQFTAESERAFYEKWYRPENMTLVIVGDLGTLDPTELMTELFAGIPAPESTPAPEPSPGPAAPKEGTYTFFSDEIPLVTLSVQKLEPWVDRPGNTTTALRDVPVSFARRMVNLRFRELAKKPGAPFLGASLGEAGGLNVLEGEELSMQCEPEQWQAALAQGEQELRRALEHGFRQAELDEVRADALRALDEAVQRDGTRPSSAFVGDILQAAEDRLVPSDAATDRSIYKPAIAALTIESCHAALKQAWSEGVLRLSAVGGLDLSAAGGAPALRKVWDASAEQKVEAPPELSTAAFAYHSKEDAAGEIVERKTVEDLGLTQVRFANGVRLDVKPTDFREHQVLVRARFGQGLVSLSPEQAALGFVAEQCFAASGLAAHSADDLRRLTAGKQVGVDFGMNADAFTLDSPGRAGTTAEDLLFQCELTCAYLTNPGWREEGLREVQEQVAPLFKELAHQTVGPLQTQFLSALHKGDERFGLPPQAELEAVTLDQIKAWLGPQLAEGPLEVSIVGDVDLEAAIAAAARTFGALPARKPGADVSANSKVEIVPGLQQAATVVTDVPGSLVYLVFPTTDGRVALQRRQLSLLSQVVSDRLRIEVREKLGAAYSPQAGSQASDVLPGVGFTWVQAAAGPGTEDTVLQACLGVTESLAKDGVTDEELGRQREPVLARLRDQLRDNNFWRETLDDCQARPQVLEDVRTIESDYRAITTEQLSALAAKYFTRERGSWIVVKPEVAATGAADPSGAAEPTAPSAPGSESKPRGG